MEQKFTILLSIITLLFMIGLIIFIFALMGGELTNATSEEASGSIADEVLTLQVSGDDTSVAGFNEVQLSNVEVLRCGT